MKVPHFFFRDYACLFKIVLTGFLLLAKGIAAYAISLDSSRTHTLSQKQHVVFLISEDPSNYDAHITIPLFADSLQRSSLFKTTVLKGRGTHAAFEFDGLEALETADLLFIFCRRVALPHSQMERIRSYLKAGKPIIGIRTANHGFSALAKAVAGHEGWWGFVPDILGCENKGYEPEKLGTLVNVRKDKSEHPILRGIAVERWKCAGAVYRVALVDPEAEILFTAGNINTEEPAAWTRTNYYGGKVFYTSLGYPNDFSMPQFRQLLVNAMHWSLR